MTNLAELFNKERWLEANDWNINFIVWKIVFDWSRIGFKKMLNAELRVTRKIVSHTVFCKYYNKFRCYSAHAIIHYYSMNDL